MALSKITNTGIDNITVDSSGRLGIGGSPTENFEVFGAATNGTAKIGQLMFKNSSGNYAAATDGVHIFPFSDGNMYINNFDGGFVFRTGASVERLRIDSSGDLLIGATSTSNLGGVNPRLIVQNSSDGIGIQEIGNGYIGLVTKPSGSHNYYAAYFENSTPAKIGGIYCSTTSTSFQTSSDYRLKENVTADWDATTRLKQLNPVRFNFIADADVTVDGFLAHEVQDIVPEAISGTKDAMRDEEYEVTPAVLDDGGNEVTPAVMGTRSVPDYQGIDQSKLVPLLVKTIQELEARIVALETA